MGINVQFVIQAFQEIIELGRQTTHLQSSSGIEQSSVELKIRTSAAESKGYRGESTRMVMRMKRRLLREAEEDSYRRRL